jgi:hypothetical protein
MELVGRRLAAETRSPAVVFTSDKEAAARWRADFVTPGLFDNVGISHLFWPRFFLRGRNYMAQVAVLKWAIL